MEGNQVIEIAGYEAYYNKGKRCLAIKLHDGTISKLIVTEPPESPDDLPKDTPHS